MADGVIDNSPGRTLSGALDNVLPSCEKIDALVGYFYFSGFREIYEEVADKKIRILVGLEIDNKAIEKLSRINEDQIDQQLTDDVSRSRVLAKEKYFDQFAAIANRTDIFDSDRDTKAFNVFLKKIEDGSLEIRKTATPQHGKFYILTFKDSLNQDGLNPGVVIEGSSNLTRNGLIGQGEHNRLLRESHYYQEDVEKFESLWNDSETITIADKSHAEEFKVELKKRLWIYAQPEPYLLYLRVLHEYYSTEEVESMKTPGSITDGLFTDLQYQIDAINIAIDRINTYGGVIVADVVGLGKSIIASAIAHNLDLKTVIIAPPHLKDQWDEYRTDFDFNAQVFTTGKIDEALERYGSRKEEVLVIIDEAHKHRNEDTESYQSLHKLCAGNKVVALSATPFNNDPKDVYALIKLFDTPGQSTLRTVKNLSVEFRNLIAEYKSLRTQIRKANKDGLNTAEETKIKKRGENIASQLRQMIEPIVIRRSRLDLDQIRPYKEDLERQGISFAKVEDPKLLEYDLGDLTDLYIKTLNKIYSSESSDTASSFIGARYKPAYYIRPGSKIFKDLVDSEAGESADDLRQRVLQGQSNIAKFMRTLLVRRFESSIAAFQSTLDKMLQSSSEMLKHYNERHVVPVLKKGYMPSVEDLNDMDESELEELLDKLRGKGLIEIPASELDSNFVRDLQLDIQLLSDLKKSWSGQESRYDPKFEHFLEEIERSLKNEPNRKLIVFSEFADTANYIQEKLIERGFKGSFKYSSGDSTRENKEKIRLNFDAGLSLERQRDDFYILVATDAISEGYNLHRAGTVINYDIPYNPTRVIQRIGRINRVNKKVFDKLYIYNFFPSPTGELDTRTKAISTLKMDIIHALMGEDTKILTGDEELRNFFAEQYRDEEALSESLSWDAAHRNEWMLTKNDEKLMAKVMEIPLRTRIGRKINKNSCVVAFAKLGANYIFASGTSASQAEKISPEDALALFHSDKEEKPFATTASFDAVYQTVKKNIFKSNTVPTFNSRSRRHEAIQKLKFIQQIYPDAQDYCSDIIKIVKDYDALPEGLVKSIVDIKINKNNPKEMYQQIKLLVPVDYIAALDKMANRQKDDEELLLLSEEIMHA